MAVGKPLHLRLFLEGEEVPVIAAQISINLNSPAAAAIQVIPLDEVMDLQPRTMVHLFFLDNRADDPESQVRGATTGSTVDVRGQYRLLYSGEVVAFSFVQTPQSRGTVLQCLDFSSYWDSAHATALEYGVNGNAFSNRGTADSGTIGIFDDIVNQQAQLVMSWVNQKPQSPGLTSVNGLAGGVIRILEAMGGIPGHFVGFNDFFTVAELRVRLLSQITAEQNDNTSQRLFGAKVFDEWLRNGLQNIGLQVTIRDMIKLLCQYIYYEFVPNPAAKFDPSTGGTTTVKPGKPQKLAQQPQGLKLKQDMLNSMTDIHSLTDSGGSVASVSINAIAQRAIDRCNAGITGLKSLQAQRASLGKDIKTVTDAIATAIPTFKAIVGNNSSTVNDLLKGLTPLQNIIKAITDASTTVATTGTTVTTATTQRLHTQILRPDCWFVAPPRCNVIFPDMYSQFSYERNFLSETTRVLLMEFDTLIGRDELLANRILAPNIGFNSTSLSKKANTSDYRLLMDHEIHTGILPKTEWLSNIASVGAKTTADQKKKIRGRRMSWMDRVSLWHFFRYRFASRQASVGMRFNPFVVCGFPGVVIKAPYIVPGGVKAKLEGDGTSVSDDQLLNLIDENASVLNAPNQIIGMFGSVSHNVDQSGGSTSVSIHHARRHRGVDDAFIENFITGLGSSKTRAVKTSITLAQAEGNPKLLNILAGVTPQTTPANKPSFVLKQPTQVSAQYSALSFDPISGQMVETPTDTTHTILQESSYDPPIDPPPLTVRGRIAKTAREDILVPSQPGSITTGSKNGIYGKQGATVLGVEVLNASLITIPGYGQMFNAVDLFEDVPITLEGTVPIEEIIRPAWFSNSYSNALIGTNIYDPFFGCGSVVDDINDGAFGDLPDVPGSGDDPDVSSFSSDTSVEDVISALVQDETKKNVISIEKAINVLGYVYGQVKTKGVDVDEFIRSYIDRPIATISEIFGSLDLELRVNANGTATATRGTVGFHTGSTNPILVNAGNYTGISEDLSLHLQRINNTGQAKALPPAYDVRKDNKTRVIDYVAALSRGPGFRG